MIQGNNTAALGPGGGGLGYGPDLAGGSAANSILKSVAVKFDLYSNSGETANSTGSYTNGASPTTPYVDLTSSGIDLHSGHVFNVHMTYDGIQRMALHQPPLRPNTRRRSLSQPPPR
jgi:hypothetical protein